VSFSKKNACLLPFSQHIPVCMPCSSKKTITFAKEKINMMQTMSRWKMRAAIAIVLVLTIFCIYFGQEGTASGHEKIYITGVTPIEEEIAVEYNTPWEEVLAQLPKETAITVSKGDPIPVSLNWTSESEYGEYVPGIRGLYLLTGTFELPDGVYQPDPPIDLKVELIIQQLGSEPLTIDDPKFNQPGTYLKKEMMHSGQQRTYYYYLPSSIEHSMKNSDKVSALCFFNMPFKRSAAIAVHNAN